MTIPAKFELLEDLAAQALGESRAARDTLRTEVFPRLPVKDRTFVQQLAVQLDRGGIFGHRCANDLHTLLDLVEREVERGTKKGQVFDDGPEYVGDGVAGWTEVHRTAEAEALAGALADIRAFVAIVDKVRDLAEAEKQVRALRDSH